MPKSKRRKKGKSKARQYGKQIRDQKKGKEIQQDRLFEKYQEDYRQQYEDAIGKELERRDNERASKIDSLTEDLSAPTMDFLGDAKNSLNGLG